MKLCLEHNDTEINNEVFFITHWQKICSFRRIYGNSKNCYLGAYEKFDVKNNDKDPIFTVSDPVKISI